MAQTSEDFFLIRKKEIIDHHSSRKLEDIYFIGIDRSLAGTGFCIVKNGKMIESREISCKYYGPQRLLYIVNTLMKLISRCNDPFIIMEDYAFAARSRSVTGLAELKGTLISFLFLKGYKYLEVAPKSLKKYVSDSGNSKKNMLVMFVLKKFGIQASSDNTADAISLAMLGYNSIKYLKGDNKYTLKEIECFNTFLSLNKKIKKNKTKKGLEQLALEIIDA